MHPVQGYCGKKKNRNKTAKQSRKLFWPLTSQVILIEPRLVISPFWGKKNKTKQNDNPKPITCASITWFDRSRHYWVTFVGTRSWKSQRRWTTTFNAASEKKQNKPAPFIRPRFTRGPAGHNERRGRGWERRPHCTQSKINCGGRKWLALTRIQ